VERVKLTQKWYFSVESGTPDPRQPFCTRNRVDAKKSEFPSIPPAAAPMQTVLTIAGFDPSSGAGITADLMVFAAHGLFGTSAITALTVQSTQGVRSTHAVSADVLGKTLNHLDLDLPPAGIKIGMLGDAANVAAVCDYLEVVRGRSQPVSIPVVLDPILRASSGRELLHSDGLTLLRDRLLPLVDWVTPNLAELAVLTGLPVARREDLPAASLALQREMSDNGVGSRLGVLATGGHLDPPDDLLLTPAGEQIWLPGVRIETRATHGTGCALSSAFLSRLALGDSPADAARAAKQYVAAGMSSATIHGSGNCSINHLWPLLNPDN
jgi:hydroxymethylpyrimidine/phosphomethylpyrimidine kinase